MDSGLRRNDGAVVRGFRMTHRYHAMSWFRTQARGIRNAGDRCMHSVVRMDA
jgi:hypothetical protein